MINNPLLQLSTPEPPPKIKKPSFERNDNASPRNAAKSQSQKEPDDFKKELNKAAKANEHASVKKNNEAPSVKPNPKNTDKETPVVEPSGGEAALVATELNTLPTDVDAGDDALILDADDDSAVVVLDASLLGAPNIEIQTSTTLALHDASENLIDVNQSSEFEEGADLILAPESLVTPFVFTVKSDVNIDPQAALEETPLRSEMPFSLLKMIKSPAVSTGIDLSSVANDDDLSPLSTDDLLTLGDDVVMAAKDNKSSGQGGLFNMSLLSASSFSQPMAQFAQKLMAGADNGSAIVSADLVDTTTLELDADAATPALDAASKNAPVIAMNKPVVIATTVRVGMPGWADQIAERTASLVSQNIKQAEIILNPQDMGTIHVKLTVSHDQAAITFVAQSAQVRELLDQSVQRLRDTLASDGVELIQSDVRDQQQFASDQQQQNERDHTNSSSELLADKIEMKTVVELEDGIDHFV